jgi:A/G-specific adenine glycosylase
MLQQTQVKMVLPYWERWMRALPDIGSLAEAEPEFLHKLWEGLGYYTRVRNMQKAAQEVASEYDGEFPTEFERILELPGIGRYTAGAICSIAFNQPKPILDGNVIRVLTRVFGISGDPREKKTNAHLWELAEELVKSSPKSSVQSPESCCSHFNQALMELGALVCTPRQPQCPACPLARRCVARREGRIEELPALAPRVASTERRFYAFVAEKKGRFLVRQRPAGVVNAHLWEFPNLETASNGGKAAKVAAKALGIQPKGVEPFCTIRHTITRYRIQLEVFKASPNGNKVPAGNGRWLQLRELDKLPFSSAHKKIVQLLSSKS